MSTVGRPDVLSALREERGSVAMIAAIGLVLMLTVVISFVSLAQLEAKIGTNRAAEVQALQAAEAGARRAIREIADASVWPTAGSTIYNTVPLNGSTYTVTILDNGTTPADNTLAMQSTGTFAGVSRTIALLFSSTGWVPMNALTFQGSLTTTAAFTVRGPCGTVYVPDIPADGTVDISISNHPYVQGGISTSGTANSGTYYKADCNATNCPDPPGTTLRTATPGVGAHAAPTIDPTAFAKYADYWLYSNGTAYRYQTGAADPGTITSGTPDTHGWVPVTPGATGYSLGWKYTAPNWNLGGATDGGGGTPGTFYVSGNAVMNSDIGSGTWKATIIATGSINIAHSMSISWDDLTTTSSPPSLNPLLPKDVLLVAGTDIKMTGAVGFSYHGMIAAHEQIDLTNQTQLSGIIIAENMGSTGSLVTANKIEGAVKIDYDCTVRPVVLTVPTTVLKWVRL